MGFLTRLLLDFYDPINTAMSVVIATLQYMIKLNLKEIDFTEKIVNIKNDAI